MADCVEAGGHHRLHGILHGVLQRAIRREELCGDQIAIDDDIQIDERRQAREATQKLRDRLEPVSPVDQEQADQQHCRERRGKYGETWRGDAPRDAPLGL